MSSGNLIGLVYNSQSSATLSMTEKVAESLNLPERIWVCAAGDLHDKEEELSKTSVIVVAGGDGTILRLVRNIARYGIPLVGINMGRVGFMAELSVDETLAKLPDYIDGKLRVEERMMLQATVTGTGQSEPRFVQHALNDVVVSRGGIARLLDIKTTIDGFPLTSYRADAVIASTATGSTGYALSAGGPILYPETRAMLIQPVAAHTGLSSGLILPDNAIIDLEASDDHEAVLSVDGFLDAHLHNGDRVTIKKSPYVTKFLRAHGPGTFYAALTRRLGLESH